MREFFDGRTKAKPTSLHNPETAAMHMSDLYARFR